MTRREQKAFVRRLVNSTAAELLATAPRWPAEWDGHELRELVKDRFAQVAWRTMDRERQRDYKNECLTRNLL